MTAPSREAVQSACEALSDIDPALARAYGVTGVPEWRTHAPTYALLARTVVYQLVSTRAADAIWGRVEAFLGEVTPERVLACDQEALRACGLSRPKLSHMNTIAAAIADGALDLARLQVADVHAARAELLAVKGIGPWTADLYLLYAAGKMDAFPHGDAALMEAHRRLSGYEVRMDNKAFSAHAERWRPHRGVAAHLLWGWVNAERAKAGIPPA
ncbi:DNA-3-methyladenine glycosylase 2 family protein [uncultured Hyphomonas sp.]|uniref:DNA-3-methyladenine glycosylase family protein n=1 Tax=uncultured Hyphomonas sp. TaxID=225298 RepID=UPI002AAAB6C5|nr:DNA-3-methyladenine glycosylase 2 family protein [uncultured Hyphomonas sp.]